jgi:hypothetical protein
MGARLLIGCGVLQRELERVVQEQGWVVDLQLLGPALHTDLDKLERLSKPVQFDVLIAEIERHALP